MAGCNFSVFFHDASVLLQLPLKSCPLLRNDLIEEASLSFHARLFSFAEVLTLGKGVSDRTLVFEKKEERQSYHDNVLICFCTLILYNLDC